MVRYTPEEIPFCIPHKSIPNVRCLHRHVDDVIVWVIRELRRENHAMRLPDLQGIHKEHTHTV